MAVYDYISVEWSNGCNIDTIYYGAGFSNKMYFINDLSAPEYNIEDDSKKSNGTAKSIKQIWTKSLTLNIICNDARADVLTIIPLHESVTITDKDGNVYSTRGADVTIEVRPVADEVCDGAYYPIMEVRMTFNSYQIVKTACCDTAVAPVECSDTLPTIDDITEIGAGTCLIEGTAPANHFVRLYERDYIDPVLCENGGKINDVCIVSELIAYACSNGGDIYKTTDGGNAWTKVYDGSVSLYGIAYDGVDKIFAVGAASGGDSLALMATVGTDTFAEQATPSNVILNAVRAMNGDAFACGANGTVLFFDSSAGTWSAINLTATNVLYDIEITYSAPDYRIAVVGYEILAYTDNTGAVWKEFAKAGETYYSVTLLSWTDTNTGTWIIGDDNGSIWQSSDNLDSVSEYPGILANRIVGLSCYVYFGDTYIVAMDTSGYFRTTTGAVWSGTYKQRSQPTSNRIRIYIDNGRYVMMSALGNGNVGTTETPYTDDGSITAAEYEDSGYQFTGSNNVTYQFSVQTYTHNTDPCEDSLITIFTT